MGIPVTVTVDDHILTKYEDDELVYARSAEDGALWVPILEKAFAKLYGNYELLNGGWMGMAIQTMTGAPFYEYYHPETSVDELWDLIVQRSADGWMITAGSIPGMSDQHQDEYGIAYSHAYTVL